MALQDIESNSAVKNSLYICSANNEMPYSGQLNTIQKEMPQLKYHSSKAQKKNIQYAHRPLKAFPLFFSEAIYSLCLRFQFILPSQHALETSLSMEKPQTISKNYW